MLHLVKLCLVVNTSDYHCKRSDGRLPHYINTVFIQQLGHHGDK